MVLTASFCRAFFGLNYTSTKIRFDCKFLDVEIVKCLYDGAQVAPLSFEEEGKHDLEE